MGYLYKNWTISKNSITVGALPFKKQCLIKVKSMEIPQYLKDALYQFSQDVLLERDKFDELEAQAQSEIIAKEKHKESWLEHLFKESDTKTK
jgi:hypothetical protein